jgi:hypothetical protein
MTKEDMDKHRDSSVRIVESGKRLDMMGSVFVQAHVVILDLLEYIDGLERAYGKVADADGGRNWDA